MLPSAFLFHLEGKGSGFLRNTDTVIYKGNNPPHPNKKNSICVYTAQGNKNAHTVELHLHGLIGAASHPDTQKIRIIGFFFENRLHWQFEVPPLLFTARTCV